MTAPISGPRLMPYSPGGPSSATNDRGSGAASSGVEAALTQHEKGYGVYHNRVSGGNGRPRWWLVDLGWRSQTRWLAGR